VFDKGELKESGKPGELLNDPYSLFADMAKHAPGLKSSANSDEESATTSGVGGSTEDMDLNGL